MMASATNPAANGIPGGRVKAGFDGLRSMQ
jgi:hypothetical protein